MSTFTRTFNVALADKSISLSAVYRFSLAASSSFYRSGIWQSVDLGRNAQTSFSLPRNHHLEGYEAAQNGFDPDARIMTSFAIMLDNGKEEVRIWLDNNSAAAATAAALASKGEREGTICKEPEPAHLADSYASAPSPLYDEHATSSEKW